MRNINAHQSETRDLYLRLLRNALTFFLWTERLNVLDVRKVDDGDMRGVLGELSEVINRVGLIVAYREPINADSQVRGYGWPGMAHSMIGQHRMDHLRSCIEDTLVNDVKGDLIETGVWRGGATIFMRGVLRAYGITEKRVWVADSFCRLPNPSPECPAEADETLHLRDYLSVSVEEVRNNFARYDLLDEQVCFLEGWFCDSSERTD